MPRPEVPGSHTGKTGVSREPYEYEAELAKYKAIVDFVNRSGDLSDTTDLFKGFEAKWIAFNRKTGYDCSLRLAMYREFKKTSPDRGRMSRSEIVRLLSQPKVVVHGSDLLSPEIKEPGFWESVWSGAKSMVGIKPQQNGGQPEVQNGTQRY